MTDDQPIPLPRVKRVRKTKKSVLFLDGFTTYGITIGGISTILAVSLVMFYLLFEVLPLFLPADLTRQASHAIGGPSDHHLLDAGLDDQRQIGWRISDQGTITSFALNDGTQLSQSQPLAQRPVAIATRRGRFLAAFADGRIQLGTLAVTADFVYEEQAPAAVTDLAIDQIRSHEGGVYRRISHNQWRKQSISIETNDPRPVANLDAGATIEQVAISPVGNDMIAGLLASDDTIQILKISKKTNILTRKVSLKISESELSINSEHGHPRTLLFVRNASMLLVLWKDGYCERYSLDDFNQPQRIEHTDFLPANDAQITYATTLIGDETVLVGDDQGRVNAWFLTRPELAEAQLEQITTDGQAFVLGHQLAAHEAAVARISSSTRMRLINVAYADGLVRVFNVTTEAIIAESHSQLTPPLRAIAFAPKDDGILVCNDHEAEFFHLTTHHPDVSFAALFLPVWYESYPAPITKWQSTGGSDGAEAKLGLWVLIFGTLKATVYAMIFAVPVAIGGAIFASEFLDNRISKRIKPGIELMASLPSVVLGFIAGLELAPVVETALPMTVACFAIIPLTFVTGGQLWQLLPQKQAIQQWRPLFIALGLPLSFVIAWLCGPLVETLFFGANIMRWLDGDGSALGGWLFLTLPASALLMTLFSTRVIMPWLDTAIGIRKGRKALAQADLLKFGLGSLVTFLLAVLVAWLLSLVGDARGSYVGTYSSRNALVVGIVMGFAVIPLIYTISEDALKAVPNFLRAASLGCGATPWQTAVRVIMPTAMSGLFSATMIGLGRAIGETMIVLMATGNTPVLDMNMFNGMRTLSANIAVELPEAPVGGTHYRILFLSALILFLMTFVLNTVAELVRQRFRKKALSL